MLLTVAFALELFLLIFLLGVSMSLFGSAILTVVITIIVEGAVHTIILLFIIQKPVCEPVSTRPVDQIASYTAFLNTQDPKSSGLLEGDIYL